MRDTCVPPISPVGWKKVYHLCTTPLHPPFSSVEKKKVYHPPCAGTNNKNLSEGKSKEHRGQGYTYRLPKKEERLNEDERRFDFWLDYFFKEVIT